MLSNLHATFPAASKNARRDLKIAISRSFLAVVKIPALTYSDCTTDFACHFAQTVYVSDFYVAKGADGPAWSASNAFLPIKLTAAR